MPAPASLTDRLEPEDVRGRYILYVAILASALLNISIAGAELALAAGIILLIVWKRFAFPHLLWIPLVLFLGWTVLADIFSPDPLGGWPYLKKAFDFLFIPLLYVAFRRHMRKVNELAYAWTAAAVASGLWGFVQYFRMYANAKKTGGDFYVTYLSRRITGFQGHWMMFGALQLAAFTLLMAHCLFARRKMPPWVYAVSAAVFVAAIVLSWDRGIWLAMIPVVIYLIAMWRPKLVLLVPVALVVILVISPSATRERVQSLFRPHGDTDSNRFRVVTFETGLQMIERHPWLGIGPDQVPVQFNAYVPANVQRPLPTGFYGHLHNTYLEFAAERGIPALAFFLLFIGVAVRDCARAIHYLNSAHKRARLDTAKPGPVRQDGDQLFILHATIGVVLGVLVEGLVEHSFGDSEVLMTFVAMIGLAYAAIHSLQVPETI